MTRGIRFEAHDLFSGLYRNDTKTPLDAQVRNAFE
jgi:hypothetical protein